MEYKQLNQQQKNDFFKGSTKLYPQLKEFLIQYQMVESQVICNIPEQCTETKLDFFITNSLIIEEQVQKSSKAESPVHMCQSIYLPFDYKIGLSPKSCEQQTANKFRRYSSDDNKYQCNSNKIKEMLNQTNNINFSENSFDNNIPQLQLINQTLKIQDDTSTCADSFNSYQCIDSINSQKLQNNPQFNQKKFIEATKKILKINIEKITDHQRKNFIKGLQTNNKQSYLNNLIEARIILIEYEYMDKIYLIKYKAAYKTQKLEDIEYSTLQLYFGILSKRFQSYQGNIIHIMPIFQYEDFIQNFTLMKFKEEKYKSGQEFQLIGLKNLIYIISVKMNWIYVNIDFRQIYQNHISIKMIHDKNEELVVLKQIQQCIISTLVAELKIEFGDYLQIPKLIIFSQENNMFNQLQYILEEINELYDIQIRQITKFRIVQAAIAAFSS